MKRRVSFHPLSKWLPIVRAKLRKKLGLPKGIRSAQMPANELGFGLAPFVSRGGFQPSSLRIDRFFRHEFRVLGTEWRDLPGHRAIEEKDAGYRPIDWKAEYGKGSGEDIKLPWELSRFHGFAEMAYCAQGKELSWVNHLANEILSQLEDFSSSNSVGEGAHWGCAMDVSLRALNITIACELLRAAGWQPSQKEEEFLAALIRLHGRFVFQNLEWYRVGRGNHYLANLVGLLSSSLWLGPDRETQRWLEFSAHELLLESERQFLPDGSNFEGSVFYHRLSLELMALGFVFLQGPAQKRERWEGDLLPLAKKVQSGLSFLRDLTDCQGHGVQFGDNDSGRALKIYVPEIEMDGRVFEDSLHTRDTLSLEELFEGGKAEGALGSLALWIAGGKIHLPPARGALRFSSSNTICFKKTLPPASVKFEIPVSGLNAKAMECGFYEDFGVYFWKNGNVEIWLRCGPPSKDGHGGHAHFDQLHLEVRVDGLPLTFDPGSYAYTGDRSLRNHFRGPEMHFIPRVPEREALTNPSVDPFRYPGLPHGECLSVSATGFCGRYSLGNQSAYRKVQFENEKIHIWDWAEGGPLRSAMFSPEWVSWGYGEKVRWPLKGKS